MVRHGSFFTGIGGFDYAASRLGWENVFQVEKNKYCLKVLEKHFPNTLRFEDIKEFDPKNKYGKIEKIDIISGGFPCQPFSTSGKRRATNDDRYLWPELLRCIREIKPTVFVGENVTGIVGLALDTVLADLEGEGYTVETFIIPACAVGAPHIRERVWIVAYTSRIRRQDVDKTAFSNILHPFGDSTTSQQIRTHKQRWFSESSALSNTIGGEKKTKTAGSFTKHTINPFKQSWWATEPSVGRVAHGVPYRVDRLEALGNAIVPAVAFRIFKVINDVLF